MNAAVTPEAPVSPGDVLAGKYKVDRVLAVGGMGVVVAATHLALEEKVALKFMLPQAFADPDATARFLREARAAVKLKSEHVAKILDTGVLETGAPYIVMEFLKGRDLSDTLQERGASLDVREVTEWIVQACDALAEAHALGIVHRDLKPANLFLASRADGSPLVKVLDFGISKADSLNEGGFAMTKTSTMMGSPLYMSPEQMKSAKSVDARTDVWSLGVILYELAGGRVPFNSDTLGGLMAQILQDPPPPLAQVRPDLPPGFIVVVDRCLEKSLDARCRNVAELAVGLAPFCPPRTLPIIDRITTLLGSPSMQVAAPAAPPTQSPDLSNQASAMAISYATSGGLSASGVSAIAGDAAPKKSVAGAIVFAAALFAVLLVGGGLLALRYRGALHGVGSAASPAASVAATQSAARVAEDAIPAGSASQESQSSASAPAVLSSVASNVGSLDNTTKAQRSAKKISDPVKPIRDPSVGAVASVIAIAPSATQASAPVASAPQPAKSASGLNMGSSY